MGRSLSARIQDRLERDGMKIRRSSFRGAHSLLTKTWFAKPGSPKPHRPPATALRDVERYVEESSIEGTEIKVVGLGFQEPRTRPLVLGVDSHPLFEEVVENYAPRWVAALREGRIFDTSTVVTADNYLLESASFEFDVEETRDRRIFHRMSLPKPVRVDKPLVSVCTDYSANYFHFMLETIPRIVLYRDAFHRDEHPLYRLDKPQSKFQRDALAALGIDEKQLVDPVETPYVTAPMVYATTVDKDERIHPQMIDAVRRLFLKDAPEKGTRRIYVERGQSPGRRIVNEQDLIEHLKTFGFESVRMDGLSLTDQADLFASCEAVCALHGAALTNLAYAPEGSALIELMPPTYVSRYYWDIATRRNMTYCVIIGEPEPGADLAQRDNFANTFVPLSLLTQALEHLGITRANACKSN